MKKLAPFVILSLVLVALWAFNRQSESRKNSTFQSESFAVVELFTSQGCSSCPAADKVLSELIAERGDKNIYGLSFHVTYWNKLGWKDPYSSEAFTNRQREYSRAFNSSTIYTPQMIVNGSNEFVGSKETTAKKAVSAGLNETGTHNINFTLDQIQGSLKINYRLEGKLDNYNVNIALVERGIENSVPRGENRNRTLHHDNVVRVFETTEAKGKDEVMLDLPENINRNKAAVIVYVQQRQSKKITGAASISI